MRNPTRTLYIVLGCLVLAQTPAAADPKGRARVVADLSLSGWLEVSGPNFTLISNTGKRRTVEISQQLVSFSEVVRETSTIERFEPRIPIRIVVFDSLLDYQRFGPPGTAGLMHPGPRRWHLLVNGEAGAAREILFHEFSHFLVHNQGFDHPRWFDEGFAELVSTVRFRDDLAFIGMPPANRLATLAREEWLPIRTVLGARVYPRQVIAFYAQSWLLTHYLHTAQSYDEPPQLASMQRYLELLHANTPWARAFSQAFLDSPDQLDAKLARHRKRVTTSGAQLPLIKLEITPPNGSDLKLVRLSPSQSAERLAAAQLALRGPTKAAERLYRANLDLEPEGSSALAGLATMFALQGRGSAAIELAQRAVAQAPGDLDATLALGLARELAATAGDPPDTALLEQARAAYRSVIASYPKLPVGFVRLGKSYVDREGDISEGIAALEHVQNLMPSQTPRLALATLYLADDRTREARKLLWTVQRWEGGESAEKARELLEQLDRDASKEMFSDE